jgi:hypothetical protein
VGGAAGGWIAEGSGGTREEFLDCVNRARGSLFAAASWLFVFRQLGILDAGTVQPLLECGDTLGRRLGAFSRRLRGWEDGNDGDSRGPVRGGDQSSGEGGSVPAST